MLKNLFGNNPLDYMLDHQMVMMDHEILLVDMKEVNDVRLQFVS